MFVHSCGSTSEVIPAETNVTFLSIVSKSCAALVSFLPPHLLLHSLSALTLVSQDKLCLPHHILEEKGLVKVSMTVQALVDEASPKLLT